jgi:hypothetical protein
MRSGSLRRQLLLAVFGLQCTFTTAENTDWPPKDVFLRKSGAQGS